MATVGVLQRLCQNEKQLTYLQLLRPEADTSPPSLGKLISALKKNTHVNKVRIFVQRDFFAVNEDDDNDGERMTFDEEEAVRLHHKLFQAVGCLPTLEEIKIDSFMGLVTFPVHVLSRTVCCARQLKEIELWDLKLAVKSSSDLESLQYSLQDHPSLKKFTLYNCQLEEDATNNNDNLEETSFCTSMDPLLYALATIPTLKQVYITAAAAASSSNTSMAFSCSALEHLCHSTSLEELGLWKFNFTHSRQGSHEEDKDVDMQPLVFMAPAIAKSDSLKMFEFGKCDLSPASDEALANMLRTNTSLEELDLHLHVGGKYRETITTGVGGCNITETAKALETNRTMKRLKLWGLLSRENQQALVEMICNNYCLETCRLLDADRDISVIIDFYLALNRNGRRRLLMNEKGVTMEAWIEFFAEKAGDDLSTIFYYLSVKPSLCCIQH